MNVANAFPDLKRGIGALQALACAHTLSGFHEEGLEYVDKCLNILNDEDRFLRSYLFYLRAICFKETGRCTEALTAVHYAIITLPLNWQEHKTQCAVGVEMHTLRALAFRELGDQVSTINAFGDLRILLNLKDHEVGGLLSQIVHLFNEKSDPDSSKLLTLLQSWKETDLLIYTKGVFESGSDFHEKALERLSSQQPTAGRELVLKCLNDLLATLSPQSDQVVPVKFMLANLYREQVSDEKKAAELYRQIVKQMVRNLDNYDITCIVQSAQGYLAEMIFSAFRNEPDPVRKGSLLQEMKDLPIPPTEVRISFDALAESSINTMLALMYRRMGPVVEYQAALQRSFHACLLGLRDDVRWNDMSMLRLLAKVLACVPGLERDALIALSCQYSQITNESKQDTKPGDEGSITTGLTTQTADDRIATAPDKPEPPGSDDSNEDLGEGWVFCIGECKVQRWKSWTESQYLCLFCRSCDLCSSCYDKRMEQNSGKPSTHWRPYCGLNHKYLRGPIVGWKGIKDGIIRIEKDNGEVEIQSFSDWLRTLENERWPAAWKEFWLSIDDIKGIGT